MGLFQNAICLLRLRTARTDITALVIAEHVAGSGIANAMYWGFDRELSVTKVLTSPLGVTLMIEDPKFV